MKVFELKKRKNLSHAIHAIALVEKPAIEEDFIYLSVDGKKSDSAIYLSEEKGLIYSPVLIPEQRIKRLNAAGEEFEIFFSKETIQESAYDMMKAKALSNFNEEHTDKQLSNINVVELWVVDNPKMDKSTQLGFNVPEGTLMAGIKIDDEETKANIKAGKIKGISIEGLYEDFELVEETKLNKQVMNKIQEEIKALHIKLNAYIGKTKLASIEVGEGVTLYTEGEFSEGVMVYTDAEMTIPASGEFTVDGRKMTISEGALVTIEEAAAEAAAEDTVMTEANQVALAAGEAAVKLSEKVTSLEAENKTLKTELSEIRAIAENNKTLLSKVEEYSNEKNIKLSTETPSEMGGLNKHFNKR